VSDIPEPVLTEAEEASRLDEIVALRRAKVAALRARGIEPYAVRWERSHSLADVRARWAELDDGSETGEHVTVAGRLVAKRRQGKLSFGVLREDGVDLQLFVQVNAIGEDGMAFFDDLDLGDWVGVVGEVISTRRGELSVRPSEVVLLSKGLRPLPDKWHGLRDVELRYRQRELDLVVNEDARRVFRIRSRAMQSIRDQLIGRGFLEVETPILHPIAGGAVARPFVTHHNTLDLELFLRVAPELYLKRLIAGGFPKVFEINRSFRNEGISPRHNPEFTMLETYEAYADHLDVMAMTEQLIQRACVASVGSLDLVYQGREVTLAGPWRRATVLELTREATGRPDLSYTTDIDELRSLCKAHDTEPTASWGAGKLIVELYEKLVEPTLWEPTFVMEHPVETSPLARRHRDVEHVTERFELIIVGREHANAFSELIDPDDQRRRFEQQAAAKAAGDDEAMVVDEAYLRAMELGLPPTGGLGLGIDRLVMLLADVANIREVILFPTLRPE